MGNLIRHATKILKTLKPDFYVIPHKYDFYPFNYDVYNPPKGKCISTIDEEFTRENYKKSKRNKVFLFII